MFYVVACIGKDQSLFGRKGWVEMTHNRSNTTTKFTHNMLGESMTPRLSNFEQKRRAGNAEFEARQKLRKKNRINRNSQKSRKASIAIALLVLAGVIATALCWHCYQANANVAESVKQEYVNDSSMVELPNGEFVDREDYERANEEAHQAEREMLGLEG